MLRPIMNAPQKIGPYPVERELGRGGMGIVYLGRDTKLDRPVAIKVLTEAFVHDPERLARFEREARLLASLNHPNIAGIYGLEEADGHRFLALEYVEGETLAERLARGPLPVDEVKRFDDLAHRRRLSVKPGITCLWQVSGRNNVTDFRDWVRLDLEYIDNWSFWLDLKILFRTIPVVLLGTGAK